MVPEAAAAAAVPVQLQQRVQPDMQGLVLAVVVVVAMQAAVSMEALAVMDRTAAPIRDGVHLVPAVAVVVVVTR